MKQTGLFPGRSLTSFFILAFLLSLASTADGQGQAQPRGNRKALSLKFSGGMGFLTSGAGNLDFYRQGRDLYVQYWESLGGQGYTSSFNWKRLSAIPDFNFEVIFNFTRNFGIGMGTGVISKASKGEYSINGDFSGTNWTATNSNAWIENYKLQAIPISLNFYFFLPLGSAQRANFYAYAGGGYYIGKMTHGYTYNYTYYYEYSSPDDYDEKDDLKVHSEAKENLKQNTFGFRTGLGYEVRLSSAIFLGLEFFGRFVNFHSLGGDYSDSSTATERFWDERWGWYKEETDSGSSEEKGDLYIYDYYDEYLYKTYPQMWIWKDAPSGPNYRNVRRASINLNTVGILFSLRIRFGQS
jgi:hypothetical protein